MRGHLRKLFALLKRRDRQWLLAILAAMVVSSLLEVISVGSVPLLITLVADPGRLEDLPLIGKLSADLEGLPRRQLVVWGGLAFLAVFAVRTTGMVLTRYAQLRFAATRQVRFSTELFNRYLLAPYLFHLQHNSSELIRNIQVGAMRIGGQVIGQLLAGLQNLLLLASVLALLLLADPAVTLISLGIFGVFGLLFIRTTSRRTRALGEVELRERKAALQTLHQSLEGIREIQLLGKPSFFVQDFRGRMRRIATVQRLRQMLAYISGPLLETLAIVTLITLTFSLLALGRDMAETLALLGLYAVAFVRLKNSLAAVLGTYTNLTYSLVSIDPVFEGLRMAAAGSGAGTQDGPLRLEHSIALEGVSFRYPGTDQNVFDQIWMTIPKGAYVGIVGATGAGKSTLINLLLGILPPTSGEVRVDGHDIRDNLHSWQCGIGYVPQDLFLLDDTIRRNVALGENDAAIDDGRVRSALDRAQLLDFVDSLPEGVGTLVGERGVRLSGGQKQRVSIARALYRSPSLLILDEATSALDSATEAEFLRAILRLKGDLTIVSVAHRSSTLTDCDHVFELSGGKARSKLDLQAGAVAK